MINVAHLVQLKAFARQDALLLALLWAASFACIMMLNAELIGNILALATPFLVGKRLAAFRTQALYGVISFRRAYAYSLYVFIYASLVFALVQYAYFQFLDNGAFVESMATTLKQMTPIYEQNGMSKADIKSLNDWVEIMRLTTPVQWAFMFMMQNLFVGAIISLPIALIGKRNRY